MTEHGGEGVSAPADAVTQLSRLLRRVEAGMDVLGWDRPPILGVIYRPDEKRFRLSPLPIPDDGWDPRDIRYGPAQVLYEYAHRVHASGFTERASGLQGWAFGFEAWSVEGQSEAEKRRNFAAMTERAVHLMPNRLEIRAVMGMLRDGRMVTVRRERNLPGVEVDDHWERFTGVIGRSLRLLNGLDEAACATPTLEEMLAQDADNAYPLKRPAQ